MSPVGGASTISRIAGIFRAQASSVSCMFDCPLAYQTSPTSRSRSSFRSLPDSTIMRLPVASALSGASSTRHKPSSAARVVSVCPANRTVTCSPAVVVPHTGRGTPCCSTAPSVNTSATRSSPAPSRPGSKAASNITSDRRVVRIRGTRVVSDEVRNKTGIDRLTASRRNLVAYGDFLFNAQPQAPANHGSRRLRLGVKRRICIGTVTLPVSETGLGFDAPPDDVQFPVAR
jgi:hypothetical protein